MTIKNQCGDQWPPVRKTGSFSGFGGETCINSGRVRKFTKSRYYHNMIINLSCWKIKKILTVSFLWKRFRSVFFSRVGTTSRSPTCRQSIDSFVVHTSVYYYDITFAIRNIYLRVILINKFVFDERSRRVRSRAKRTVPLRLLFCMSYHGIVFRNSR